MGEAWPPGRLHKCSHLIWSRAGGPARVWVGGAGRGVPRVGMCPAACPGPVSGARSPPGLGGHLRSPEVPVGVGRACPRGPLRNKGQSCGTLAAH